MRLLARASLGFASLAAAACAGSPEPGVSITSVIPAAAYSDTSVNLAIQGGPFRPAYEIDTTAGTAMTQLGAFTASIVSHVGDQDVTPVDSLMWLSPSQIAVVLHQGLPAGDYDIQVRDPRGSSATKNNGFTSLGPDRLPPSLTIDEPMAGAVVVAQTEVPVAIVVDDGAGFLDSVTWQVSLGGVQTVVGSCPLEPNAHSTTCRFVFVVPEPSSTPQALTLVARATDTAMPVHNTNTAQTTLTVGIPPSVTSFSPSEGHAVGGTPFTVKGDNFITGTKVLLGDTLLEPNGGTCVDAQTMQGTTPVHAPGTVTVSVQTGSSTVKAPGFFEFVGQPQVIAVTPASGPAAGGTAITVIGRNFRGPGGTTIRLGSELGTAVTLSCAFASSFRLECTTPPGSGAPTLFANDPVGGMAELMLAFTYLDVDVVPDAGTPDVAPDVAPDDAAPDFKQPDLVRPDAGPFVDAATGDGGIE